jgi:hypothetical protein
LLFSASEVFFSNKNIVVFLLMSGERKLHPWLYRMGQFEFGIWKQRKVFVVYLHS